MTANIPDSTLRLPGRLAEAFEHDQRLAEGQNEAPRRLRAIDDELRLGLHPDALGLPV